MINKFNSGIYFGQVAKGQREERKVDVGKQTVKKGERQKRSYGPIAIAHCEKHTRVFGSDYRQHLCGPIYNLGLRLAVHDWVFRLDRKGCPFGCSCLFVREQRPPSGSQTKSSHTPRMVPVMQLVLVPVLARADKSASLVLDREWRGRRGLNNRASLR